MKATITLRTPPRRTEPTAIHLEAPRHAQPDAMPPRSEELAQLIRGEAAAIEPARSVEPTSANVRTYGQD
jgi:hypothetical protein